MVQRQIALRSLVCVLGLCLVVLSTAFGQTADSIILEIEVLPNGTYYPQDVCESRPLKLRFKYYQSDPTEPSIYSLESLNYTVQNGIGTGDSFFKDTLYLENNTVPNTFDVITGIYIPPDSTLIQVAAGLWYSSPSGPANKTASATTRVNLKPAWPEGRPIQEKYYDRLRDGFIRRHILDSGRGLSTVWLKQFEYCLDSNELLPYSRTQKVEGITRTYIPWTYKNTEGQGGSSVAENSAVIYGGDENPLLRTGLAMATFAIEFINCGRPDSLYHALKLFRYIEESEWTDPATDEKTGFFLRSRWPGNVHESGREYFYASADEITGMTLGLVWLRSAFSKAYHERTPGVDRSKINEAWINLENLGTRLGRQIRNNFYLIVPLIKETDADIWRPIGLPVEFQKGYAGLYALEWFLARGFAQIGYDDFNVPDHLYGNIQNFLLHTAGLELPGGESLLDIAYQTSGLGFGQSEFLAKLQEKISPYQRALLSIQLQGLVMRYRGRVWNFERPKLSNVLPWHPDPHPGLPEPYIPCPPPLPGEPPYWPISIDADWENRYNYVMLLHAFQLGWRHPDYPDEYDNIKAKMGELIFGVLNNGYRTTLRIPDFIMDILGHALALLSGLPPLPLSWVCELAGCCDISIEIGSQGELYNTYDQYSAAIARRYNLPFPYSGADYDNYWEAIQRAERGPFPHWLPMAERSNNSIKHNMAGMWGRDNCWEKDSDPILPGGEEGHDGLYSKWIDDTESRFVDTMREGSAIDYLLPFALRSYAKIQGEDPGLANILYSSLDWHEQSYLGVCTTNPVSLARADLGYSNVKCSSIIPDTEKPTSKLTDIGGDYGTNDWYVSDVTLSIEATDCGGSGVKEIRYSIDGGAEIVVAENSAMVSLVTEGEHEVTHHAIDMSDNIGVSSTEVVKIDKTPPTVTFGDATPVPNAKGWNKSDVVIPYTATDNLSGIATTSPPSPLVFTAEGSGTVQNVAIDDNAGNSASFISPAVNLDKTSPSITITSPQTKAYLNSESITIDFTASDALSGLATLAATLDDVAVAAGQKINLYSLSLTNHVLAVSAIDNADNSSGSLVTFSIYATAESTMQVVNQLLASGAISNSGVAGALKNMLELAGKAIAGGQTNAARAHLTAFIQLVNAQTNKSISLAAANALIAAANYILSTLPQ